MKVRMRLLPILGCVAAFSLAGCDDDGPVIETGCSIEATGWECWGKIDWSWSSDLSGPSLSMYVDPYYALASFDGSTVGISSSGVFRMDAFDAQGAILASTSANWVLNNNGAYAADPAAIDNWIYSLPSGVRGFSVEMLRSTVAHSSGTNTFQVTAIHEAQTQGTAGTIFHADSCTNDDPLQDHAICL